MRRIFLLVTVASVMAAFAATPAMAQSNGSGLYPVGPETASGASEAAGVDSSFWSAVKDLFSSAGEDTAAEVAKDYAKKAPDSIDPYKEFKNMDKGFKKEALPEYEKLLEDAKKTGDEAINDDFFPDLEDLWDRVNDALDSDDGDSDPGSGDGDPAPGPNDGDSDSGSDDGDDGSGDPVPDCGRYGCGG